jgi:hypothetical protein
MHSTTPQQWSQKQFLANEFPIQAIPAPENASST